MNANRTFEEEQHVESHAPYITVFLVLLNFTAMEYIYASFHTSRMLPLYLCATAVSLTIFSAVMTYIFKLHFSRRWVLLTLIPAILLSFISVPLILGLMVLAVTKAALVGLYFMHLIFEGNWVYYMLVPAAFLATVFIVALYPDIGMQPEALPDSFEEEAAVAPLNPGPELAFRS
jgi:hypothetical protein